MIDACAPEDALLDRISAAHPDVVLLEGENALAPNLRFVRELIRATPDVRIVLLGMAEDELTFLDAVRSGVCGYVLRDAAALDVLNAVRAAGDGEVFCPPRLCMGSSATTRGKPCVCRRQKCEWISASRAANNNFFR